METFWKVFNENTGNSIQVPWRKSENGGRGFCQICHPVPTKGQIISTTLLLASSRICRPSHGPALKEKWKLKCTSGTEVLFYIRFNTHHLLLRSMSLYQNKGTTLWSSGHEIMHLCSQNLKYFWVLAKLWFFFQSLLLETVKIIKSRSWKPSVGQ